MRYWKRMKGCMALVLALSLLTDVSPVIAIVAAAVAGILIKVVGGAKK